MGMKDRLSKLFLAQESPERSGAEALIEAARVAGHAATEASFAERRDTLRLAASPAVREALGAVALVRPMEIVSNRHEMRVASDELLSTVFPEDSLVHDAPEAPGTEY